jgi:hypothetical protein
MLLMLEQSKSYELVMVSKGRNAGLMFLDNKGLGAGWFLHSVTIAADNKATLDFPCNRWLDKAEDDKQIVRDLVPGQLPPPASTKTATKPVESPKPVEAAKPKPTEPSKTATKTVEPPKPAESPKPAEPTKIVEAPKPATTKAQIKYKVIVRTGEISGAGTDANVFIHLFGDAGETGDIVLKGSDKKNPFEKGQIDNFVVDAVDVGTIQKLRIGHGKTVMFACLRCKTIKEWALVGFCTV